MCAKLLSVVMLHTNNAPCQSNGSSRASAAAAAVWAVRGPSVSRLSYATAVWCFTRYAVCRHTERREGRSGQHQGQCPLSCVTVMELATALSIYLTGVVFLVWVFILSDPTTDSLGGRLNIFFTETLAERVSTVLKRFLPERAFACLSGTYDYVVNQRNPLLQGLYVLLFFGSFILYSLYGFSRMDQANVVVSSALFATCVNQFRIACSVPAGFITKATVSRYDNYEADNVMYTKDRTCHTCHVPRVARSKHCSLCHGCISRFDHHCAWLNQCVGERNYKHFIAFLALHAVTFWWGLRGVVLVLAREMRDKRLLTAKFWNPATRKEISSTPLIVAQYFISHEGPLCAVGALALVMGTVITGFLLYHLLLVSRNVTTNETFKWAAIRRQYQRDRERVERAQEITAGALRSLGGGDDDDDEAPPKMPDNMYNLGVWQNFMEVMYPRAERPPPPAGSGGAKGGPAASVVPVKKNGRKEKVG